mmetsp:Transcript_18900/g.59937  ORF Transcript_18900/g.59937 Transcript_18900/m.59937 type:complete len:332 (-) Transcript_18900:170-1165(-)
MRSGSTDTAPLRILARGERWAVVEKPPGVPCHAPSRWDVRRRGPPPTPVLQRARDTLGARVNLVHRLDSGTSGVLLLAIAGAAAAGPCAVTRALAAALQSEAASKTYYALVRGEAGHLRARGRFAIDRPLSVSAEPGRGGSGGGGGPFEARVPPTSRNAVTHVEFLAGCEASRPLQAPHGTSGVLDYIPSSVFADTAEQGGHGRASLVRCQPSTGRWHQIRRHLAGLGTPVLGDGRHGNTHTNREWRNYGFPLGLCLHCAQLQLPATDYSPALRVRCALPDHMCEIVQALPFAKEARDIAPELFQAVRPHTPFGFAAVTTCSVSDATVRDL